MKIAYGEDILGQSTVRYKIVAETLGGQYVVERLCIGQRPDGTKYLAQDPAGLRKMNKSLLTEPTEKEI